VADLAFITLDVSSEQINLSLCMEGFDRLAWPQTFKNWFEEQILPYISHECVIVMDNASIH
jgi:hypothetical protein